MYKVNSFIYKCGLTETEMFNFCTETKTAYYISFGNVYTVELFGLLFKTYYQTVDLPCNRYRCKGCYFW